MGGFCIDGCAEGRWPELDLIDGCGTVTCFAPWKIYDPAFDIGSQESSVGRIRIHENMVVLDGVLHANLIGHAFELAAPVGSAAPTKARLLGASLLLNQLFFQRDDGTQCSNRPCLRLTSAPALLRKPGMVEDYDATPDEVLIDARGEIIEQTPVPSNGVPSIGSPSNGAGPVVRKHSPQPNSFGQDIGDLRDDIGDLEL